MRVMVDAAGNMYIADTQTNVIRYVSAATGIITTIAGTTVGYSGDGGLATLAKLNAPGGIDINSLGEVHIADSSNGVIRKLYSSNAWSLTGNLLGYTPTTAANWTGTAPTTIYGALDRIAAALAGLSAKP